MALKDDVEALIRGGKLTQYVRKNQADGRDDNRTRRSPRKGKTPATEVAKVREEEEDEDDDVPDTRRSRGRQVAMMITGGIPTDASTNKSIKGRFDQIMSVASTSAPRVLSKRPPILFGDEDLIDRTPNNEVPLVVVAVTANMEVRRILIDQEYGGQTNTDRPRKLHGHHFRTNQV